MPNLMNLSAKIGIIFHIRKRKDKKMNFFADFFHFPAKILKKISFIQFFFVPLHDNLHNYATNAFFMIDYIHGQLTELNPTYAVLEAAGVGYEINIALPTFSAFAGKEGETVKLYITEIIREDTHDLFGFTEKAERALFVLLMTVSGIGGNTARMIMSAYTAGELRQIIATGNAKALAQVKGLGPKTAQRIIVDLKDKVLKLDFGNDPTELPLGNDFGEVDNEIKTEAVSALTMLGFAAAASAKVVDKILKASPEANVESVIRQALKML